MRPPQQQPSAFPQQRYSPPPHPHQRYPQPAPQQPLPQQQVYLIPAAQPQPDVWRKRLLIINAVIACLVILYLVSQSPGSSGAAPEALAADGKSNLASKQASLSYPAEMAIGEYREPIDHGERWTVYTQTQDPSSHVELTEFRNVRVQNTAQKNQFIAERSTINSQDAGQTITPQPVKAGDRDAYVWSYYDSNRNGEIRNLWVPGATMSHRVQCKILDAERARGLQMCEAAVTSLTVKSR